MKASLLSSAELRIDRLYGICNGMDYSVVVDGCWLEMCGNYVCMGKDILYVGVFCYIFPRYRF
jgi:hypothetical protein